MVVYFDHNIQIAATLILNDIPKLSLSILHFIIFMTFYNYPSLYSSFISFAFMHVVILVFKVLL